MTLPDALELIRLHALAQTGGLLDIAAVALVFMLAGFVKGVVGLGLPTLSMALLALMMPPADAAALLVVPSLLTNLWQARPWHRLGPLLRRLLPMQAGVCAGTLAGAWLWGAPAGAWASLALGLALIAYAAWALEGPPLAVTPRTERRWGAAVGAVTGLVTAATGVFVVPAVPWLQALGLRRDELMQAMGVSFTVSTLALGAGLAASAHASGPVLGLSALMLLPAVAGMALGQALARGISAALFRRVFMGSLWVLGVYMVVRTLMRA